MNIIFDEKAKIALNEQIQSSEGNFIRLKVLSFGCGKPALGIIVDKERENDIQFTTQGINFVIEAQHKIYFENVEIKYNPEVFNNGFYVHSI